MPRTPPAQSLVPGAGLSAPKTGLLFRLPDDLDDGVRRRLAEAAEACMADDASDEDVTRLRDALSNLPASVFRPFVDRVALRAVSERLAGGTNAACALAEAEAERFADELAGDGGPLVRAAAVQAATARVVLGAVTEQYARLTAGSYSMREAEHVEKRLNGAHLRFLRALATVAKLREVEARERASRESARRRPTGSPSRPSLYSQLPPHAGDGAGIPADVEVSDGLVRLGTL